MAADPLDIRRIDLDDGETTVWVPVGPVAEPAPAVPTGARAWSVRPVTLAVGGALAAAALLRLGVTSEGLLAAGVLFVVGLLAVIDLESRLLPNRILLPAAAGVLAFQAGFFSERLVECIAAALGAAFVLLLPSLFKRGAMGMGDVKLAGLLGAALGGKVLAALTVGSLASVPVALVLLLRGSSVRDATLPFGPFLAFGAAVVLLG